LCLLFAPQDNRFNHDIDLMTGYRTRTLLCMPIKDCSGEVIGVAQVRTILFVVFVISSVMRLEGFLFKQHIKLFMKIFFKVSPHPNFGVLFF
jgi:GAF domain